jgi:hypothetical protein
MIRARTATWAALGCTLFLDKAMNTSASLTSQSPLGGSASSAISIKSWFYVLVHRTLTAAV